MTQKANAPVFVLIVLLIISLSLAGGGFYLFQKERLKAIDLATKLAEVSEKERISTSKLQESQKVVADLQTKLQNSRDQIDKANAELQQEKAATQDALSSVEQLKAELQKASEARSELEKKISDAETATNSVQDRLKDLQKQKDVLETQLKQLSAASAKPQGVELGNIVVSPEGAASIAALPKAAAPAVVVAPAAGQPKVQPAAQVNAPAGGLEGKVLVINKDYNFAVINIGAKDGVKIGDTFSVSHEGKPIGDIKVEKVHESMAAAGFVNNEEIKGKISEGDKVVQKGK